MKLVFLGTFSQFLVDIFIDSVHHRSGDQCQGQGTCSTIGSCHSSAPGPAQTSVKCLSLKLPESTFNVFIIDIQAGGC